MHQVVFSPLRGKIGAIQPKPPQDGNVQKCPSVDISELWVFPTRNSILLKTTDILSVKRCFRRKTKTRRQYGHGCRWFKQKRWGCLKSWLLFRHPHRFCLNQRHPCPYKQKRWGCLKSWLLFRHPRELKIKSLYINDLIFNIAKKPKETVQKLKFSDSPLFAVQMVAQSPLFCGI